MPVSSRSSAAGKLPLAAALSPTLQLLYTGLAPVSAAVPWVFGKQTKIAHSPLPETTGLCTFRMQRPSFYFSEVFEAPLFESLFSVPFLWSSHFGVLLRPLYLGISFTPSTRGYSSSPSTRGYPLPLCSGFPLSASPSGLRRAAFTPPSELRRPPLRPLGAPLSGPLAVTSWPSSRPGSDLWMPSRGTEYG